MSLHKPLLHFSDKKSQGNDKAKDKGQGKGVKVTDAEDEEAPPPPPLEVKVTIRLHHWVTAHNCSEVMVGEEEETVEEGTVTGESPTQGAPPARGK